MPDLLPDESPDIREEIRTVVSEPERWLDIPNDGLGGLIPGELIGTPGELLLRELIRRLKHGVIS